MENFGIYPKLTKDYILSLVNQEQIFEYYFGIRVDTNNLINSPLREDKTASFGFKYKDGRLRGRDFGGYFWGDCFDAVAYTINVDSKTKQGFGKILDQICKDFRLHKYSNKEYLNKINLPEKREIITTIKKKVVIQVKTRGWNNIDSDYWSNYGITREDLNYFGIYPIKYLWINKQISYYYNPSDIGYAYIFKEFEDKKLGYQIKAYFPNRDKYKFILNTSIIQGIDKLKGLSKELIITKSYKDVICLYKLGYDAIAPQSESTFISENELDLLFNRYEDIIIFYDNDKTGIERSKYFSEKYNLKSICIPLEYKEKDISDYISIYRLNKAKELMKNLLK